MQAWQEGIGIDAAVVQRNVSALHGTAKAGDPGHGVIDGTAAWQENAPA
jgi:hypothetical protein